MADVSKHPLEDILKNDPAAAKAYDALSFEEQKAYWHEQELAAKLTVRDSLNPDVIHQLTPVAAVEPKFKVKIAGVEYTSDTLEGLYAQYEPALKAAVQASNVAKANDSVARNPNGTFAKQPSVTDSLDRVTNGLVTKALQEELGITPEELKASVQQIREGNQYMTTWAVATQEFLKANPDYTGDAETVKAVGERLVQMGLDAKPSAESIQKAYDSLAEEAERYLKLKDAHSPQEIRDALGITERENSALRYRR